jgi:hypothetical protein
MEWAWMMLSCDAHPLSQKVYFADFAGLVTPIHPRIGVNHERQPLDFQLRIDALS